MAWTARVPQQEKKGKIAKRQKKI